jgi:DNA-binding response OmpR family regulator
MARILVINDDDSVLDTYEAVIAGMGHEAVTKAMAASGPEVVRDVGADALIVDLQRPGEEEYGLRIIEELRAEPETQAIPIVLATGAGSDMQPVMARLRSLEVEVVPKPFEVGDLEAVIDASVPRAAAPTSSDPLRGA